MDPAQASVEPVETEAEPAAASGYIPIDIGNVIPADHKYERISVSVEGVPRGATLSRGRDNGDETWTLMPDELPDLAYIPSKKGVEPHLMCFRIIGIKGGFGEALGSVDINIEPDAVVQGSHIAPPDPQAAAGGFSDMAVRYQAEVDSEVTRRLESAKVAWERETQSRLAELAGSVEAQAAESADNGIDSAQAAELQALVADAESRVQAAEDSARNATEVLTQAIARAEAAEAEAASLGMNEEAETLRGQLMAVRRELSGVTASMRVRSGGKEEIQKEVREAVEDEFANQMEELHERYGQELERLTKLATAGSAAASAGGTGDSGDFEARLAEARGAWERDIEAKLASVESATKKAIIQGREAAVSAARQQWEQELEEKLAAARAAWQASQGGAGPDPQQQADTEAAVQKAIAARDQTWQAEMDRRIAEAQAAWQSAQSDAGAGVGEDELARRIEAARQEWQIAQNQSVEARDQEWQSELDRRIAEEQAAWRAGEQQRLAAAQAVGSLSGMGDPDDEQRLAAAQEEWAQAQTLDVERRLLEAEQAWQANDEERLQAAKAGWDAEQQVLFAERDEQWKAELNRQLEEAKQAWRTGVEDHTPELEIPAVVAVDDAPVGVTAAAAPAGDAAEEGPVQFGEVLGQEVILGDELPSFFEEHAAETAPDRELSNDLILQDTDAAALHDETQDSIPEWLENWAEKLRIPPHWLPAIQRFGRRVSRAGRFVGSKLRRLISFKKPSAPPLDPAQLAASGVAQGLPQQPTVKFRDSKLARAISTLTRGILKLIHGVLKLAWAVVARLLRLAIIVGIIVGLYRGYYFAKPHVYPHVKPYITAYWDPYAAPYVTTYWDPYVQPHIDRYWGSYAKPYIVNTWANHVQPPIDEYWGLTKSFAVDGWEGMKGLLPDGPPPARAGASVSKGAAKAKASTGAAKAKASTGKPKLSAVAPRVYLRTSAANVRASASKYAAQVGTARHGDHIQRLEENGGWIRIRIVAKRMVEGWVHGALLSDKPVR